MATNRLTGGPAGLGPGMRRGPMGFPVRRRTTPAQQAQRASYAQARTLAQPDVLNALLPAAIAERGMGLEAATHPFNVQMMQADAANDRAALAEQRQRAGVDVDYYNKLLGFAPRGFNLAEQLVGLGREEAGATKATATRNLNSDFTARGAWGSEFQRQGLGDIEGEFSRTGRGLDVKSGQNKLGLDQDIASAQHGLFGAQASASGAGARSAAINQKLAAGLAKMGLSHVADMDTLKLQAQMGNARAKAIIDAAMFQAEVVPGAGGLANTGGGEWPEPKKPKKPPAPKTTTTRTTMVRP